MSRTASAPGLLLVLAGPPLVAAASVQLWGDRPTAVQSLVGQAALWALAGALLTLVRFRERRPLSSIGIDSFSRWSLAWGAAIAATLLYIATPVGLALVNVLALAGFDHGLARLRLLPLPVLASAALTAAVVEELFYRGYAIERLSEMTGSRAAAALLSLAAFSLAHLPFWGITSAVFTLVAGAVLTVSYLWKRDLTANMIGHGITAMVQLSAVTQA